MRFLWLIAGSTLLGVACGGSVFTSQSDGQAGKAGQGEAGRAGDGASSGEDSGDAGSGEGGSAASGGSFGGSESGGSAGVGAAGASAGSGGATDIDNTCPVGTPVAGRACRPGLTCGYGSDIRPLCRQHYSCPDTGRWLGMPPAMACPPLGDCSMTPSGFPIVGKECKSIGEECTFDGGQTGTIYCRCSFCGTGASCPGSMTSWACAGPPASPCPVEMPNEGQACDSKRSCSYGVPCAGATVQCDGKTWARVAGGCADGG